MDERVKCIIDIIEKIEGRINTYWNFYFILIIAIIGWLMSSKTPFTTYQAIVLTIALCMFFTANYFIVRAATKRVVAFEDELNFLSKNIAINSSILKSNLLNASIRGRLLATGVLHIIINVAVLFAIWSKLL
jgi:hypothetical protein